MSERRSRARAAEVAEATRLGQEYDLGAYERTQVDKDYPLTRGCGMVVFPVALITSPTAVIPFFSSGPADFVFGLIWAPIIGALLLAGALMLWRSRPRRVDQTRVYSGGLLQQTDDEPEPRLIRWDDVTTFRVRIQRPDDSDAYIAAATVCDERGTCATTRGGALARRAAELLTPVVVPPLIASFDAGQPVSFGPLCVDRSGITDQGATPPVVTAWPDVKRISFDARVSVGIYPAGRKASRDIDLEDVPNGFLAHYVIEHAAKAAGVPVSYVEDKRLPPRS